MKLYLLLVLRKFRQTRSTFYINLIGLSLGLTSALMIYLWVYDEMDVDRFHENNSQLYTLMQNIEISNGIVTLEVGIHQMPRKIHGGRTLIPGADTVFPAGSGFFFDLTINKFYLKQF